MKNTEKLKDNIRALRKIYNETQEELAFAINAVKSTIANYEIGIRYPDAQTLSLIAEHYLISVDDLLYQDYSEIMFYVIECEDLFWKFILLLLPPTNSGELTDNNTHYKKANTALFKLYSQLIKGNYKNIDTLYDCIREYELALEDLEKQDPDKEKLLPQVLEIVVNEIAVWFIRLVLLKSLKSWDVIMPSALGTYIRKRFKSKSFVLSDDPNEEERFRSEINDIDYFKREKTFNDLICVLKCSAEWSDLGDYYLLKLPIRFSLENPYRL